MRKKFLFIVSIFIVTLVYFWPSKAIAVCPVHCRQQCVEECCQRVWSCRCCRRETVCNHVCSDGEDGGDGTPPTPKGPIMGVVWYDFNENTAYDAGEAWGTSSCSSNVSVGMNVNYGGSNASWGCQAGPMPYYSGAAVDKGSTQTVTLTPPNSYDCSWVTWSYTVCGNAACNSGNTTGSGTGCTATVPNISENGNHLWWKIAPIYRSISGNLGELTGGVGACNLTGTFDIPGLSTVAYQGLSTVGSSPVTGGRTGLASYNISRLYNVTNFNTVCVNGPTVSGNKVYVLKCAASSQVACTVSSGSCVSCNPNTSLRSGNVALNFGFNMYDAKKWYTSIDGDLFGANIITYVATNPQAGSGFKPNIIINRTGSTPGGFGLAETTINTQTLGTSISAKGGGATQVGIRAANRGVDSWLHSFGFKAPANAITAMVGQNNFVAGKVYKYTAAQMNTILARADMAPGSSYAITGGVAGQPNLAIIFVEDLAPTISITKRFISANPQDMLIIVSAAPISIAANLSVPNLTTFSSTSTPQIQAILVSKGSIDTNTVGQTPTYDLPIVFTGSLLSRSQLALSRSLGGYNNSLYPSEVVNYVDTTIAKIIDYEMANTTISNYTGITTFDTQWEYIQ